MHRDILIACLPYLLAILASLACLRIVALASGAQLDVRRLLRLHRDQSGAVQSLSFVLTLPIFMLLMLFIVQLSQLAIGRVILEYAAFAAARSTIVWIPANLGPDAENENRISYLTYLGDVVDDDGYTYSEYDVEPRGPKFNKIHFAAAMACMPICPSRNTGGSWDHPGNAAAPALVKAYFAYAPDSVHNTRIAARIRHKLAYALNNTHVAIRIRHKNEEPELMQYNQPPYFEEFTPNEIGWQDQVLVTVTHDFALLPGPGRFLARPSYGPRPTTYSGSPSSTDYGDSSPVSSTNHGVFVCRISATVRLGNEGEKPVLPYVQRLYRGSPGYGGSPGEEPYDPPEYEYEPPQFEYDDNDY